MCAVQRSRCADSLLSPSLCPLVAFDTASSADLCPTRSLLPRCRDRGRRGGLPAPTGSRGNTNGPKEEHVHPSPVAAHCSAQHQALTPRSLQSQKTPPAHSSQPRTHAAERATASWTAADTSRDGRRGGSAGQRRSRDERGGQRTGRRAGRSSAFRPLPFHVGLITAAPTVVAAARHSTHRTADRGSGADACKRSRGACSGERGAESLTRFYSVLRRPRFTRPAVLVCVEP